MSTRAARRSRLPLWLVEGLDVAELRRTVLLGVIAVAVTIGLALAVLAPGVVPPTPLVGAAVAFAALLLGYAAALSIDAADLVVRGPRHVRAAGGELVAVVPSIATVDDARPLARAVLEAREGDERILLGLASAGREVRQTVQWTSALAEALAREGVSVLQVDLANGRTEGPGLVEVVREGRKIGAVVSFDDELLWARTGAGQDVAGAMAVLPSFPSRLPRDLDVLLVSLPTAASREVVAASRGLDHVLVVAERDQTARVDLVAGLDALEAAGTTAQAVLVDDRTVRRLASGAPDPDQDGDDAAATSDSAESPPDPAPEPETHADPGVETHADPEASPVSEVRPDPEPEPEPDPVPESLSEDHADPEAIPQDGVGVAATEDPEPDAAVPVEPAPTWSAALASPGPVAEPVTDAAEPTEDAAGPSSPPESDDEPAGPTDVGEPVEPEITAEEVASDVEEPEVRLPEHEVRPAPAPDDDLVRSRATDVLHRADIARAAAQIEARQQTVESSGGAAEDEPAEVSEAAPEPGLRWAAPGPERRRPDEAVPSLASPREDAPTDEMAEVAAPDPADGGEPTAGVVPPQADDPLRTTAQLATLLEELDHREADGDDRTDG